MRHYITAALINCRFSVKGNCSFTKKHYLGRENSVRFDRQLLKAAKRYQTFVEIRPNIEL